MSGGGFITDLVGFEDGGSPVRDPEEQFVLTKYIQEVP